MLGREAIRLVVWDLDETFWQGTLSEGGIKEYKQDHHNIVIELAKRGIISSICSKNDFAAIEKILKDYGIWDYFIFPSIDWTSKGSRLKELIEDIQLRPETVLFIDDNPANRAEAAAHVPGLQIADVDIIPTILNHELFKGKPDTDFTRLKQYQLLQRRKQDEKEAGTNNVDFLRASNIHVAIEPNIEKHIDRAIELINRTNQLNFTKIRLPDNLEEAKKELLGLVNRYFHQSGLVRVWDNYGDYGFCGIYVTRVMHDDNLLHHFCFSCRILGMGVERWLFQKLGNPKINVAGEVASDLFAEEKIDWINTDKNGALIFAQDMKDISSLAQTQVASITIPEVRTKGGCELDAISHYLSQNTPKITTYNNQVNGAFLVRQDLTPNTALVLSPLDENIQGELNALGLTPLVAAKDIFTSPPAGTLFVMSTWGDLYMPVYRHNKLGFEVCVALRAAVTELHDLTRARPDILDSYLNKYPFTDETKEQIVNIIHHLMAHYTYIGNSNEIMLRRNWKMIFDRVPKDCLLAVLLPNSYRNEASIWAFVYHAIVNDVARNYPNVFTIDTTTFMRGQQDVQDALDHLDRMVYFNIYKQLIETVKSVSMAQATTEPAVV